MKIVVLAGGLSTERAVSLVTGTGICRALRERGHRAVFLDLFLGIENPPGDLSALFDAEDGLCPDAKIETTAPDLEAVRRSRRDRSPRVFGPHVLELCQLADGFRRPWSCWGCPIPGRGIWPRASPWIRRFPNG